MKYTEKVGNCEMTYEGTPQEIVDLYNKLYPRKIFTQGDSKNPERQPCINKPLIDIKPNINPWWTSPVYCQAISNEISKNLGQDLNQKFRGVHL